MTVFGRVRNLSRIPLGDAYAKVVYLDQKGGLVQSGKAILSPNPVGPGETGTFEAMDKSDPRIFSYEVSFEKIGGGSIPSTNRK